MDSITKGWILFYEDWIKEDKIKIKVFEKEIKDCEKAILDIKNNPKWEKRIEEDYKKYKIWTI